MGLLGVVLLLEPMIMARLMGFSRQVGGGFLFRSGLDGDQRYFQSILDAVLSPFKSELNRVCDPFVPWRILLPLLVIPGWRSAERLFSVLELVIIGLLPYLFSLVVFPQHVSVHPYCYDICLSLPAALGVYIIATQDMPVLAKRSPAMFFAALLLIAGGTMSQLIEISRAFTL